FRCECILKSTKTFRDFVRQQGSGRVDYVDAVSAIGLHELGLAREFGRGRHMRHHEESPYIHSHPGAAARRRHPCGPTPSQKTKAVAKKAKKAAPTAKAPAKAGKGKRAKATATVAGDGSKKAEVLSLLQRKGGATFAQIMQTALGL